MARKKNESIQKALAILLLVFVPLFFLKEYKSLFINDHKTLKEKLLSTESATPIESEKSFVVFIFSTDQSPFNLYSFQSVLDQDYTRFEVVFIDISSTGNNIKKAQAVASKLGSYKKIQFYRPVNSSSLGDIYTEILQKYKDDQILIPLEANDRFANNLVLHKLNHIYQDPNVWLTYSFERGKYNPSSVGITPQKNYLKTFYIGLIRQLNLKELSQLNSNVGTKDLILKGLLKFSKLHSRFIPDKLCTHCEDQQYPVLTTPNEFLEKLKPF